MLVAHWMTRSPLPVEKPSKGGNLADKPLSYYVQGLPLGMEAQIVVGDDSAPIDRNQSPGTLCGTRMRHCCMKAASL
jgi:hypothetical protein